MRDEGSGQAPMCLAGLSDPVYRDPCRGRCSLDVTSIASFQLRDRLVLVAPTSLLGRSDMAKCCRMHRPSFAKMPVAASALFLLLAACSGFGPRQLGRDQIAYSKALNASEKEQTLLNVVRLRYGDTPTFLQNTQVITGYQLQRTFSGGFEAFPAASPSTYLTGTGTVQYQETPTFTYQPLTGAQYADSIVRPLSPATILPLGVVGLPIDVLFRLAVSSVNGLSNSTALEGSLGIGRAPFFMVLRDLRTLQIAGLLSVRLASSQSPVLHDNKSISPPDHAFLTIAATPDPALGAVESETDRLLALPRGRSEFEIVYGRTPLHVGQIAVLTRSMLAVLAELGFSADVPRADIIAGRTPATLAVSGIERRPVIAIHSGPRPPPDAFAAVSYRNSFFWISDNDFDSKVAFTVVQVLMALAFETQTPGTVITIPAG